MKQKILSAIVIASFVLSGCTQTRIVTDYQLREGVLFSGEVINDQPHGNGTIKYQNGDILTAEFLSGELEGEADFYRASDQARYIGLADINELYDITFSSGRLTFPNGQFYQGRFNNDNEYEDTDGIFSYHTISGNVTTYDAVYEGGFVAGSMAGCQGTITFKESFLERVGIWYLRDVVMSGEKQVADNQSCFGKMRDYETLYEGQGMYKEGTFIPNGEGNIVFDNGSYYDGQFLNGVFHGQGTYTWKNGTRYVGEFKDGTTEECIGTIYYPVYNHKTEGLWYYSGLMQGFAKPQRGLGSGFILFGDQSTYEGELYYDGYQGFFRLGQGIQDFTASNINGEIAGGPRGSKIHKYVGAFDYQKSQWIYGDGIFYFTDYQDNPLAWIKGFYSAFVKINEYSAASIPLIEGFTPEMEVSYAPEATKVANYQTQYHDRSEVDVLFAGDSYLEMWYPSFGIADYYEDMNELDTINVGIGGTVFNQWVGWREALITRFTPQNIVLHLGFNDLHLGLSPEDTFTTMQTLTNEILDALPNSHIYLLTVEPSPLFADYYQVESTYNGLIKNYVMTNDNISIIDTASLFIEEGQPTSNLVTYFLGDGVHLNATGYRIWVDLIKSQLAI